MYKAKAYSAASATSPLASDTINRREATETDVQIEILYCGICHSDIHFVENDWGMTEYPFVPGHEVIGRVDRRGPGASRFAEGARVRHLRFFPDFVIFPATRRGEDRTQPPGR